VFGAYCSFDFDRDVDDHRFLYVYRDRYVDAVRFVDRNGYGDVDLDHSLDGVGSIHLIRHWIVDGNRAVDRVGPIHVDWAVDWDGYGAVDVDRAVYVERWNGVVGAGHCHVNHVWADGRVCDCDRGRASGWCIHKSLSGMVWREEVAAHRIWHFFCIKRSVRLMSVLIRFVYTRESKCVTL